MNEELFFLPWSRRGLAQAVSQADSLSGPLDRNATINATVTLNTNDVIKSISLRGVEQVAGIDTTQILRTEPESACLDFEPNYFPFVDLATPDFPWLLTPAKADSQGRLRPWLVLVVVTKQEGVTIETRADSLLPILNIESPAIPADELPDLTESWAWAHVQSSVALDDVEQAVTDNTGEVFSRIVCPRKLKEFSSYYACLVPCFNAGVSAGLDAAVPDGSQVDLAWKHTVDDIEVNGEIVENIRLPVYYFWSFQTGENGDFEALCRRLRPDEETQRLGIYPMDITDPGIVSTWHEPVTLDFTGAMQIADADRTPWARDHKQVYEDEFIPVLNAGADRRELNWSDFQGDYDPEKDDPVLAPPMYGAWQADTFETPNSGWLREMNISPEFRSIAGLGAKVVRNNQESLMASAWDQVGDLRKSCYELNSARLAVEVGRSWNRRVESLSDGDVVQITAPLHTYAKTDTGTLQKDLVQSEVPNGLVSHAFQRVVRPGPAFSRQWNSFASEEGGVTRGVESVTSRFLAATDPSSSDEIASVIDYAITGLPKGAQFDDYTLYLDEEPTSGRAFDLVQDVQLINKLGDDLTTQLPASIPNDTDISTLPDLIHEQNLSSRKSLSSMQTTVLTRSAARQRRRDFTPFSIDTIKPATQKVLEADFPGSDIPVPDSGPVIDPDKGHIPTPTVETRINVSDAAGILRSVLDPLNNVRSRLLMRIPSLEGMINESELPSTIRIGPVFEDALYPDLLKLGAHFICPGIEELKLNRVRALQSNPAFVGSFLVGANHEFSRELLWREYPADLGATYFHRFWNYMDAQRTDISDLHSWTINKSITANMAMEGTNDTIVVVRGDLVRRYPTARYFLQKAQMTGNGMEVEPVSNQIVDPGYMGMLSRDTVFFGFDLPPDEVRGDRANSDPGYLFGIEEQASKPRFGLDTAKPAHINNAPLKWNDLSWGHLAESRDEFLRITHASPDAIPGLSNQMIDNITWGYNASHMATICWQRPFRLLIHSDLLI